MNWLNDLTQTQLRALSKTTESSGWKAFERVAVPAEIDRLHRLLEISDSEKVRGEIVKARELLALKKDVKKLLTSQSEEM